MATVVEPCRQILQAKDVLIHLSGFQQLAVCLAERLVEAFLLDFVIDGITSGPAIEMVDGKAQLAIAVGSQVGRALRRFVRLQEECRSLYRSDNVDNGTYTIWPSPRKSMPYFFRSKVTKAAAGV